MFINEKDIKEKMDQMLIQKESVCAQIVKQKDIYNKAKDVIKKYDLFKSTKKSLYKIIKTLTCIVLTMFVCCFLVPNGLLIPVENAAITFFSTILFSGLLAGWFCLEPIVIIQRTKGVTEDDYNRAIQEVEDSKRKIKKLKHIRNFFEDERKTYADILKSINALKKVNRNLSENLIRNELISNFNDFLKKPIDYSKASLTADNTIEKDELRKLIKKR